MLIIRQYDSVYRFELARSLPFGRRYWTTAYYIDGLLIDSGCAHTSREFVDALSRFEIHSLINTHSHEDHIGSNQALQQQRDGLRIFAHPLALPILSDPSKCQPLQPYRRIFWGRPLPSIGLPIHDGEEIRTEHLRFKVLFTPGHSPDHLCLYEPDHGWVFTGDLYIGGKDRALREGYNVWEIIESLRKMADLPGEWLFPGSARVRSDPGPAFREKILYLEELGEQILQLSKAGRSIGAITRTVCGGPMPIEFITLGHFRRSRLVRSYLQDTAVAEHSPPSSASS